MSAIRLFMQRLFEEWKFQFGIIRSVIDWTVVVYILIPGAIIFGFIYQSWWVEAPQWIESLPVGTVFVLFYLSAWSGHLRTFVQDADKLFLIKHEKLFLRLKLSGFVYSLIFHMFVMAVITCVFLPFLLRFYQLTILQVVSLFVLFTMIKWLIMALKVKVVKIEGRFFQRLFTLLLFLMLGTALTYIYRIWADEQIWLLFLICSVFILIMIMLYIPYLNRLSEIETNLMIEKIERTKYINLIFNFSYEIEKTNIITRKRPLLFRKSQRIFKRRTPQRGFLELFFKVFMRNPIHILGFFQMIAISSFAITVLPPMWLKITIFSGGLFVLHIWVGLLWEKIILAHPLTKKYGEHDSYFSAKNLATYFLVAIGGIIMASALILSLLMERIFDNFLF